MDRGRPVSLGVPEEPGPVVAARAVIPPQDVFLPVPVEVHANTVADLGHKGIVTSGNRGLIGEPQVAIAIAGHINVPARVHGYASHNHHPSRPGRCSTAERRSRPAWPQRHPQLPAKGIDRRAPGRIADSGHVDVPARVHGYAMPISSLRPAQEGVPLQSAVRIQLGHKGIQSSSEGPDRRAPGRKALRRLRRTFPLVSTAMP